jgi:S-adenosylmethionine synthetase
MYAMYKALLNFLQIISFSRSGSGALDKISEHNSDMIFSMLTQSDVTSRKVCENFHSCNSILITINLKASLNEEGQGSSYHF